ncbi:altered inheritance of mitochondria protein 21 isoform X2 [Sphaeramia orbicularis]|uniref:Altered inheritance of mitochondria protein 21-like n=1 Tax=Sphaeramia orbicularis TaxID=375764 RepID=A0A673CAW7_9TELE|nr:altered inheritance of mitochondria protein 21-like isoform X2 [Sphaeramia orbicularis]
METKYPTLKRPKRKLCYHTTKDSQPKQWTEKFTLEDVDKMFDDLDSVLLEDEIVPPSPELHLTVNKMKQLEREVSPIPQVPDGDHLPPPVMSASPDLDIDLDIPFKAHGPVKTSSPIEGNGVDVNKKQANKNHKIMSPILFDCEDDGKEEAQPKPLPVQEIQQNGHTLEDDSPMFECLPSKLVLTKRFYQRKKVDTQPKENTNPPVSPVRPESTVAAPEKHSETVQKQQRVEMPTRVKKDMNTFLQKFRDAGQAKPACAGISSSQVKIPSPPPEPEDDFLILEDDTPLLFSIPRKTATSKRQGQNKTSNTNKDKRTEEDSEETAKNQQESEQERSKPASQTVDEKMKKKQGKEAGNGVTESDNDSKEHIVPSVKVDGMDPDKPNKKKPQRKKEATSKDSDKTEDKHKDKPSRKMDDENPSQKTEMKTQFSAEKMRSKSSKVSKENLKTNKATSSKKIRKRMEGPEAVNEAVEEQHQEQSGEEHGDIQDQISPSEIPMVDGEAANVLPNGISNENKLSNTEEGSSSENCQIPNKRKRKQTGQWWLSCPQNTEEMPVSDNQQPTVKKTKQINKESTAAVASPVKSLPGGGLKKSKQRQSVATSSQKQRQKTNEGKARRIKTKPRRAGSPDKKKATHKESNEDSAEPIQEQEPEAPDEELNGGQSTPVVDPHRDRSINSEPEEQIKEAKLEKRQRRSPGNWWQVNPTPEDVESITSVPQQLKPKETTHQKERKRKLKENCQALGTPRNGTATVSSKPPGGAHVPPVEQPTSRRTLAMFKDIFSSAAQTPSVINRGNIGQNKKRDTTAHPAKNSIQVPFTDGDVDNMDADKSRGTQDCPPSHESSQENMCKVLRSGPSSMIELEQYEEEEDMMLPSSRVAPAALCASDLCAPPLKPLILQPNDKVTLTEWLKTVWSTTQDNDGTEITPDQFEWYFYQGRAIGFMVDLHCGSICTGKILLGSFMKKPLWVDHSATTVFNILTSSVNVKVDCNESRYNAGQSFIIPCGHAYSFQNLNAQPAVLYFTRVLAEDV